MNDIIKKKLITESIQGWFVLDNILFGGAPSCYLSENVLNKYNALKKQYLKTIFEFYNLIGYKSSFMQIPKTHGQIQKRSWAIMESLKKDLKLEFAKKSKQYCKYIAEGVDINNDNLLKKRTNFLGRSMMIENWFIKKPLTLKEGRMDKERLSVYKNCLHEVAQQLLNISSKYYTNF